MVSSVFICVFEAMGFEEDGRPTGGKKHAGGMFFSPWENPITHPSFPLNTPAKTPPKCHAFAGIVLDKKTIVIYIIRIPHHQTRKKDRPEGLSFFLGWVMGFEPTNTGTTIRGLRPLGDTHHVIRFADQEPTKLLRKFGTPEGTH